MKKTASNKLGPVLALCALLGSAPGVYSQSVTNIVDPAQAWVGYMNVFELPANGSGYDFGTSWGSTDLRANFLGTNTLNLRPCTNVWETGDTYWVQGDGVTPNKVMDASFYVQNDGLANTNLVFTGVCLSNTLTTEPLTGVAYTSTAFIKIFDGGYALIGSVSSNLIGGHSFTISLNTAGATHVQYGFETIGPDASPTEGATLGQVVVAQAFPAVPLPTPTNNAPVPTRPQSSVLSVYNSSGVYTNHPVERFLASWSGATEVNYTIPSTGKTVLKYSGLAYAGVEFYDTSDGDNVGGATDYSINATSYDTFHVDVWTPNANQFGIQIASLNPTAAPEVDFLPASGTIISNHWIGLDIPLSQFTAANGSLNLSDLQQFLWLDNQAGGGATDGTFYLDNIYFYSSATAAPTITVKLVGATVSLGFATAASGNYTVQYKNHLTDAMWQTLTTVSGNGSTQTVTDTNNLSSRFYRVYVH